MEGTDGKRVGKVMIIQSVLESGSRVIIVGCVASARGLRTPKKAEAKAPIAVVREIIVGLPGLGLQGPRGCAGAQGWACRAQGWACRASGTGRAGRHCRLAPANS